MEFFGCDAEPLREDEELILYRGHSKEVTAPSVLLLTTVSSRPGLETLKKLQHEYSFRNDLDTSWAVRPMSLSQYNERSVLVFEDRGGEPLNQPVDGSMEMKVFLRLAISIADAVGQLYQRHIIHKDLKTSNLLVASESGRAWLTGFGIASRLPRERQPTITFIRGAYVKQIFRKDRGCYRRLGGDGPGYREALRQRRD